MNKINFDLNSNEWFQDFDILIKSSQLTIPNYELIDDLSTTNYQANENEQTLIDIIKRNNIILYHGCKTFDVQEYYQKGIQIPTKDFYLKLFETYLNETKINLSKKEKLKIEEIVKTKEPEKGLFGLLQPQPFENQCSHYVLLGSERVTYYFLQLFGEYVYEKLIKIGKPTIFKIKVPIFSLTEYNIRAVCSEVLKCYLDIKDGYEYENNLCPGIEISYSIPQNYILSHYHPKKCYSYHINRTIKFS